MLRISVLLFASGILGLLLGLQREAGISFELGRFLLLSCLSLAILTFGAAFREAILAEPKPDPDISA